MLRLPILVCLVGTLNLFSSSIGAQVVEEEFIELRRPFVTDAVFVGGNLMVTVTSGDCHKVPIRKKFDYEVVSIGDLKSSPIRATVRVIPILRSTRSNFACANNVSIVIREPKSYVVLLAKDRVVEKIENEHGIQIDPQRLFVDYLLPPIQVSND